MFTIYLADDAGLFFVKRIEFSAELISSLDLRVFNLREEIKLLGLFGFVEKKGSTWIQMQSQFTGQKSVAQGVKSI